jgi:predicted DNA-binding transcriptional regulator AlpA
MVTPMPTAGPLHAAMVGFSEMHYWRLEKVGRVPRAFKLVEGGRGIGYWLDELVDHQAKRDTARSAR